MSWKFFPTAAALVISVSFPGFLPAAPEAKVEKFFSAPLAETEVAYMVLEYSGVIIRTTAGSVVIDPADFLGDDDIAALAKNKVNLVLYTHGHSDHFDTALAQRFVRETSAVIVAEPTVADALRKAGGIPVSRLVAAKAGQTVRRTGLAVRAVAGSHVGPIMLFQVQMGPWSIFHGGDSAYVPVKDCPAVLAFLPTGDPSPTASPADAIKMALDVKPRICVLFHGSEAQHTEFKKTAEKKMPGLIVETPPQNTFKVLSLR